MSYSQAYGADADLCRLAREVIRAIARVKERPSSVPCQLGLESAARILAVATAARCGEPIPANGRV